MKRSLRALPVPTIIFFPLILALIVVLVIGYTKRNPNVPKSSEKKPEILAETNKISLPVDLNNRSVNSLYLAYTFFGPIDELKKVSEGTELVLHASENDLPKFILTDRDTKIFTVKNDQVKPATINDLKEGVQVSISTTYDLKTKIWIVRTVHIVL